MNDTVTDLLQCPVCGAQLRVDDDGRQPSAGLACGSGHRFDRARQGYFNLLTGRASSFVPDTAAMAAARADFLAAGYYEQLASAVGNAAARAAAGKPQPAILDAGAGTGYYLARVLQDLPAGRAVAMDISKFALRRAARAVPDAVSIVWDVWRPLPISSGAIDVVVNIFAPRNPPEFARVLSPGGRLLVVTPLPGHLGQIRTAASLLDVPTGKTGQLDRTLEDHFARQSRQDIEIPLHLPPDAVRLAALMGPAAHHVDRSALDDRLRDLPPETAVTAAFSLSAYVVR